MPELVGGIVTLDVSTTEVARGLRRKTGKVLVS